MDERSRIRALLEGGRITQEEADTLLEALDELEAEEAPTLQKEIKPVAVAPAELRWVKVILHSEDLKARFDPRLEQPLIEGQVEVQEEGSGFLVTRQRGKRRERGAYFFENVLRYFEGSEVRVHLPAGWGLELYVTSGEVEVEGIPFVRGKIGSGDVELEDVQGLDLRIASGELEATLRLTQGEHKLVMGSGDAEIRFVGSSVQIAGVLGNGELDPRGNFSQRGRLVKGLVGPGAAKLSIQMGSGDLTLEDRSASA
ncbi:MAG TPA: DUF4097 family beta strand repeat-containing protein [Meiothermus sp.]|nr:DUF4097 family beta strand repeat-containing protein [Meiothermus sp.]